MSYELLTNRKTENRHKNYRQVNDIFFLVVHWWDDKKGLSFDSNVNFLCKNNNKVSAHYVSEGGRVAQIAENEDVALHAGNWNMNVASIGVENRPEADSDDFATLAELIVDIETKIGHTLYIIGSAAPHGWSADQAEEMKPVEGTPKAFAWSGRLSAGEIKFITTKGQFIPSYGKGSNNNELHFRKTDADTSDEKFTITESGVYTVKVNLINLTISITKGEAPEYTELWFVGEPTGWSSTQTSSQARTCCTAPPRRMCSLSSRPEPPQRAGAHTPPARRAPPGAPPAARQTGGDPARGETAVRARQRHSSGLGPQATRGEENPHVLVLR